MNPRTYDVLFGDVDPGGRLAQTFPADEHPTPVGGDPVRWSGVGGRQEYGQGVHVGHRWYDVRQVAPLFPVGHGPSYTTWAYEKPSVRPERGTPGAGFRPSRSVRGPFLP
ncbi:hypothetical protein [Streptomyces sp. NPDC086989]|uniref:hypothetical protein n=1 Tax=Streptomyces sp. NPDC086989 TaxID=3365764 RepID=UPI0038036044